MNAPFEEVNLIARQAFGMAPLSQTPVWLLKPAITPRDTERVDFMGLDLTVEIDSEGTIEGITSSDGSDCYCVFKEWALESIRRQMEKQRKASMFEAQVDRGQERYEERMAG